MDKQQKRIVLIVALLLVVMVVAIIVVAALKKNSVGDFVPPPLEANAVAGVPDPLPEAFGTLTVNPEFVVGVCACPSLEGTNLGVYLTAYESNTCYVKIQIFDEDMNLLGESGLLKPGEYLAAVPLFVPTETKTLRATILAYEPETYYSLGSANINLAIASGK